MPKFKTIDDLTGEEKNEIVKDYTSPSEEKLIKMIEHIGEAQGVTFEDAETFHKYMRDYGHDEVRAYYGHLFAKMFSEKDRYIKKYLEENPIEKD